MDRTGIADDQEMRSGPDQVKAAPPDFQFKQIGPDFSFHIADLPFQHPATLHATGAENLRQPFHVARTVRETSEVTVVLHDPDFAGSGLTAP